MRLPPSKMGWLIWGGDKRPDPCPSIKRYMTQNTRKIALNKVCTTSLMASFANGVVSYDLLLDSLFALIALPNSPAAHHT